MIINLSADFIKIVSLNKSIYMNYANEINGLFHFSVTTGVPGQENGYAIKVINEVVFMHTFVSRPGYSGNFIAS